MKSNEVIRTIMEETKTTQKQLQESLQLKSLSSITGFLKSDVRCATLQKIVSIMGYKVIIVPQETPLPQNGYQITDESGFIPTPSDSNINKPTSLTHEEDEIVDSIRENGKIKLI